MSLSSIRRRREGRSFIVRLTAETRNEAPPLSLMSTHYDLDDLRAQARRARRRYDLYKAKVYAVRPTTDARMRELQLECEGAEARLRAAEAEEPRLDGAPD
jgi:hypothetical protein